MPDTNINQMVSSDLKNVVTDFSVDLANTDGPTGGKEVDYQNTDWPQQLGYYKDIPECSMAIDTKATWTVGKGYVADVQTTMILDAIKGFGKDTFNTILENLIRTMHIGGDAFAEIVTNKEGVLINLKPLDPHVIKIIGNNKGIIKRYEQKSKTQTVATWQPKEIFHLSRNRVADEIHGKSMIDNLRDIIDMRNEAMQDMRKVFHRYVKPINIFQLDTDDGDRIAQFKATADAAVEDGENLYIPKGAVELDRVSIPQFSTLNPLPWIDLLNSYFSQASGVPDIVMGGSKNLTEAASKIAYLAFQQTIEEEQLYVEEQVLAQLNLVIDLEFPASLENELLSDKMKDGPVNVQPNETTQPKV